MEVVLIDNEDNVFRRVPTYLPNYIKEDGTVTSLAFKTKRGEDGLSVDLEKLTTIENSIIDVSRFKLYSLNVGSIRLVDLQSPLDVIHNAKEENIAHCLIVPEVNDKNARKLKSLATQIK